MSCRSMQSMHICIRCDRIPLHNNCAGTIASNLSEFSEMTEKFTVWPGVSVVGTINTFLSFNIKYARVSSQNLLLFWSIHV